MQLPVAPVGGVLAEAFFEMLHKFKESRGVTLGARLVNVRLVKVRLAEARLIGTQSFDHRSCNL